LNKKFDNWIGLRGPHDPLRSSNLTRHLSVGSS